MGQLGPPDHRPDHRRVPGGVQFTQPPGTTEYRPIPGVGLLHGFNGRHHSDHHGHGPLGYAAQFRFPLRSAGVHCRCGRSYRFQADSRPAGNQDRKFRGILQASFQCHHQRSPNRDHHPDARCAHHRGHISRQALPSQLAGNIVRHGSGGCYRRGVRSGPQWSGRRRSHSQQPAAISPAGFHGNTECGSTRLRSAGHRHPWPGRSRIHRQIHRRSDPPAAQRQPGIRRPGAGQYRRLALQRLSRERVIHPFRSQFQVRRQKPL